jgi:capsular exopolysaccharide synthesis family protein
MTSPIIKRFIISFEKYKWFGITTSVLVVAGATVVAIQPDPPVNYIASASLTYSRPPVSFSLTGTEIQQEGQALEEQDLLSNQIIETVAAQVGISPQKIGSNVSITLPQKTTRPGEVESTIIELKYQDTDRKLAVEVAQKLMEAMIKLSNEINTGRLKAIIQKIHERLPQAKHELQAAENKLEKYDRLERPAILAAENGSLLTAITISLNQQRQIKLTIAGISAQIKSLENKLGLTVGQAYASSALSADPIIANLRAQIFQVESQIALLKKDLRPEHPTMIQLQRQKQADEELLQQRAAEVLGGQGKASPLPRDVAKIRTQSSLDPTRQGLANQMVALQTQQETLEQQLAQEIQQEQRLRREYSLIPNKQLERSRLEEEVGLRKSVYDRMQSKLTDAQTAEAETVSSISIARTPKIITVPSKHKNIFITLIVGLILSVVIGGGVIFLLGSMEDTLKTQEDIRDRLKQRDILLLGELPIIPVDDLIQGAIPVIVAPGSPYLQFYEKLRSNLRRNGGKNLKVLLVTSISNREGKTTTVYNLGIAAARAGKRTLIIETGLRSPSSAMYLKVILNPDAAIEPLHYYDRLSQCVSLVPDIENLYIIPSPGPVLQSAAILESSEMRQMIEDARERYDLVILDTSPLSLSNDSLLLQPYSDGIVVVTRPNYTLGNMLGEALDQMLEAELGLIGVIINGADVNLSMREGAEPLTPMEEPEVPVPDLEPETKEATAEVPIGTIR